MNVNPHELALKNAEKSFALASILFPDEEWIPTEINIWVAKSRLSQEKREPEKWEREMSQIRILTGRGSVAYFLPEVEVKGETRKRSADLVLDGEIMEIKTVSGSRATMSKIAGELKGRSSSGRFICYFEAKKKLHVWTYDELRAIIGKK